MQQNNIPTAEFRTFSDFGLAKEYVESVQHRVVVKVRTVLILPCLHMYSRDIPATLHVLFSLDALTPAHTSPIYAVILVHSYTLTL